MTIYPFVFVRTDIFDDVPPFLQHPVWDDMLAHEKIHCAQQKELLIVFYFLWTAVEYAIRFCSKLIRRTYKCGASKQCYRDLLFEQEAYKFGDRTHKAYLASRSHYVWLHFLFTHSGNPHG